jgi:hypothetical protein
MSENTVHHGSSGSPGSMGGGGGGETDVPFFLKKRCSGLCSEHCQRPQYDPINWDLVRELDEWLDADTHPDYRAQPLAQDLARVAKAAEEAGEAISAFIGWTGQNPRKGVSDTRSHMLEEMVDGMLTFILGIQHFTKNDLHTRNIIMARLAYRADAMEQARRRNGSS